MANDPTPFQPTIVLGAATELTDAEKNFIDESPPNLFPENQDSNWGYRRKIFSDQMQLAIDQVDTIYNERYIETSLQFLDEWETMMNVPVAPPGLDVAQRRAVVHSRLHKGTFTEERIQSIVEQYMQAIYGTPTQFTPDGIALDAGGIPMYPEAPSGVKSLYRIYQTPDIFQYLVYVRSDVSAAVQMANMARELLHFTPSGIAFTTDGTLANILDYDQQVMSEGPSGYWPLPSLVNLTSIALSNLVASFGPATVGALAQRTSSANALSFNGTTQLLALAGSSTPFNSRAGMTVEFWVKPANVTTLQGLAHRDNWSVRLETSGRVSFNLTVNGGNVNQIQSFVSPPLAIGSVYHVVATFDGTFADLYINGVSQGGLTFPAPGALIDSTLGVMEFARGPGSANYFNGTLDEIAYYSHALSEKKIQLHYQTGINSDVYP